MIPRWVGCRACPRGSASLIASVGCRVDAGGQCAGCWSDEAIASNGVTSFPTRCCCFGWMCCRSISLIGSPTGNEQPRSCERYTRDHRPGDEIEQIDVDRSPRLSIRRQTSVERRLLLPSLRFRTTMDRPSKAHGSVELQRSLSDNIRLHHTSGLPKAPRRVGDARRPLGRLRCPKFIICRTTPRNCSTLLSAFCTSQHKVLSFPT